VRRADQPSHEAIRVRASRCSSEPVLELRTQLRRDLGNPLTTIRGGAQLLARLVQRTPSLSDAERTHYQRHLAMIEDAVCATVDVLDQTAPVPAAEPLPTRFETAQQEGEARLRLALDVAALGTWSWDLTTGRGDLDERGATIVGLPAGQLPDVVAAQLAAIHPEDLTPVQEAIPAGIATGEDFDLAYRVTYPDGSVHHVASRARALVDARGTPVRLLGTNRDVTAECEAEVMLRASEARQGFLLRLSDALRPLDDPIAVQGAATRVLGEHFAAAWAFYCAVDEERGVVVVARDYAADSNPSMVGTYRLEDFWLASEGRTFATGDVAGDSRLSPLVRDQILALGVRAFVTTPLVKQGRLVAFLVVNHSTTRTWTPEEVALIEETADRTWAAVERAHAEEALRASEASLQERVAEATTELRSLSRRLLLVQEEERRFLARELHDEIGQVLTGLQLELAAARSRGEAALAAAEATVQGLTEQVRQLSMDLRPAALDAFGLLPALQWLIERFQTQTGIEVDLRHQGIERRFPPEAEIAAYRVVQEALTNVARHAEVDRATISLLCDGTLLIVIRDEGCGFDPAVTPTPSGLRGLRERVELLEGTVAIDAALGAGVRITAEFPLDEGTAGVASDPDPVS
jgi:signal transduction histidine kinase/PAS domain-containing protein